MAFGFQLSIAGEYVLVNDERRGVVDTFGWWVYMQAKQIVENFDKDHLSDLIKRASKKTSKFVLCGENPGKVCSARIVSFI